jgi:hypothetical protein
MIGYRLCRLSSSVLATILSSGSSRLNGRKELSSSDWNCGCPRFLIFLPCLGIIAYGYNFLSSLLTNSKKLCGLNYASR